MRFPFRRIILSFATLAVLVALVLSMAWWWVHTEGFAALVRSRMIAGLRESTGGRVELETFRFNPDSLHVTIEKLVIHGKEPAASPPLITVGSADIGLKILSLWRQAVDVDSVVIDNPEIHLIVNEDGYTNIPVPAKRSKKGAVEQLLDLKARQLELKRGIFEVNNHRIPFFFKARGTDLLLDYRRAGPSYGVSFNAGDVICSLLQVPLRPIRIAASAVLYRDRADIREFRLETGPGSSNMELAGKVEHFAQPVVDAHLKASLAVNELAQFAGINDQLQNGAIRVDGGLVARGDQFNFKGSSDAHGVAFVSPAFTLRDMDATAVMVANNEGILLQKAKASGRGAHFSGEASVKAYQYLQVHGQVSQVELKDVGSYLTTKAFPWSGTAHGEAHASAKLGVPQPDFIIGTAVDLDPGTGGIPTAGHVEVTYYNRLNKVEFGESTLRLPHTNADFHGTLDTDLLFKSETTDLADLQPLIPILGARITTSDLPQWTAGGSGRFDGALQDVNQNPVIRGNVVLSKFQFHDYHYDSLNGDFALSAAEFSMPKLQVQEQGANFSGSGRVNLANWVLTDDSTLQGNARFDNLDIVKTLSLFTNNHLPVIKGVASGRVNVQGSLNHPRGSGSVRLLNLDAFGETLNQVDMDAALDGNRLEFSKGTVQSGQAILRFSGVYRHTEAQWSTGDVELKADTNGFPISSLATIRKDVPALNGRAELHLDTAGKLRSSSFQPLKVDGTAQVQTVSWNGQDLGSVSMKAVTQDNGIKFQYTGDLRETKFHGVAKAQLTAGTPIRGEVEMERMNLATAKSLSFDTKLSLPLDGFLQGGIAFDGALEEPARMHARATISELQIHSLPRPATGSQAAVPDIGLSNREPIVLDLADGTLSIAKFEIDGRDTSVKISGYVPLRGDKPMDVKAVGSANLALFMLFDPNVRSSGNTELAANLAGALNAPTITGALKIRNGSFFFADIPNGLSDVDGTVVFSRNRANIQKMTAHSGGGDISLSGSLSFGEGNPLVYHLEAAARNVRVRYANSISVTANSDLRLSGTSASSLLSGTLTVNRVVFTPNADAGNLLAVASSYGTTSSNPEDFISGVHLDVGVESAPNLQVSTNLSRDVEAEIQLRLRGTPDHPIVLGSITANQGDIKIFGTRFSLIRGEVNFVNAVRVEPVLDLDLETQARGVTVDITVSGAPSKLNFNYRSDPPLQPRDIIALLTVGRAPGVGSTSNAQGASDVTALTSGVNSVLGQAISPVSNRLSKLFGVTNIRIDPFVQGITNTPQARLSVEQQISRDVTVTYITNLSQTSEQIFRFEWALNRQFSIVALRDDNGEFGIDFQYKKRFK